MSGKRFVDSNVLLYAISDDPAEAGKRKAAREVLGGRDLVMSTQVLGEFYVNATRKLEPPLTHAEAVAVMDVLAYIPVQAVDVGIVQEALRLRERFGISYWDAQIVAAARRQDCAIIETEDLADGQDYGGVVAHNPFERA